MRTKLRKKRRQLRIIRDRRGLPARHLPVERAGQSFGLLMHWAGRNGVCVITEYGKPAYVMFDPSKYPKLMLLIAVHVAAAPLRKRNPGGVFTLADEVFGSRTGTDLWMTQTIENEDEKRPLDLLESAEGVEQVLARLNRIQQGMFG